MEKYDGDLLSNFFRFPHTPHLAWLASGIPRDDKVLTPTEAKMLLAGEVVVEEKLDGANLGFSLGVDGRLRVQNRGQYLAEPYTGQFARLSPWLVQHGDALVAQLTHDLIVFGEWCAAKHSLDYHTLPDWFLLFDVYECKAGKFWSTRRRDVLAAQAGLSTVLLLCRGTTSLSALEALLDKQLSHYRDGHLEGMVIRYESADWCEARAKLVRPDFTQTIAEHWRRRVLVWNRVRSV